MTSPDPGQTDQPPEPAWPGPRAARQVPPLLADVPPERWPRHVAIIMDGNGRWARRRGLPRTAGHRQGAKTVQRVVEEATRLGLGVLTLYAFSHENWSRPADEVEALMKLYEKFLRQQRPRILKNQIRFRNVGRREGLPAGVLREIEESEQLSAGHTGLSLCLAVNYGGRPELADAARALATEAAAGRIDAATIDERALADKLYWPGMPDVDLLIRTAGEQRISNFLLWQAAYAEFHFTDVLWPDFEPADLHRAIAEFAARERRFGGLG